MLFQYEGVSRCPIHLQHFDVTLICVCMESDLDKIPCSFWHFHWLFYRVLFSCQYYDNTRMTYFFSGVFHTFGQQDTSV